MPCDTCDILAKTASEPDRGNLIAGLVVVAIPVGLIIAAALSKQ